MDQIAREAWAKVYRGNTWDKDRLVQNFLRKYDKYLYKAEASTVPPLDWREAKKSCCMNTDTSGGLDQWTKKELRW